MRNNLTLVIWALMALSLGFYGTEFQKPLLVSGGILLLIKTYLDWVEGSDY